MNAIDYTVVGGERYNKNEFSAEVTKMIGIGWQPYGSLAISASGNYLQAMVKYPTLYTEDKQNG